MAINFGNIVLASNVLQAPCGGGVFNIKVLVNGVENGAGGTYNVFIYDDDPFPNPDDLLDQLLNVAIPAGAGRFRKIHPFTLTCNNQCEVTGPLGNSGEQTAEVYAFVREVRVFGNRANSNVTQLTCVEEDECVIASSERHADPTQRIDLSAPAGAVDQETPVRIVYSVDEPDTQFFADDVDTEIRRVAIGDSDLTFSKPVTVHWQLSKAETGILKDLQGGVVRYDPESFIWSRISSNFTGKAVTFDISSGGLFGLAAHARLSETCYSSLKIPPQTS